ncbi:hypothetical protein ACIRCZ_09520 [Leifsonia sp. NPDC102414]|uniref:hypothetical protein n=1 Tax=Leifsonia sp. NPDC102414 TaxID=3364124 RepID=UPI0038090D63
MTDERHPGTGDDAEGDERPDAPEPEFGSSEWLLQQLTGGRRIASSPSEQEAPEQQDAAEQQETTDAGAADASAAPRQDASEAAAPTVALPVVPETAPVWEPRPEPVESRSIEQEPVEQEPGQQPTPALPVANDQDTFELFLNPQAADAREPEPVAPASEQEEDAEPVQGFSWNLTPGVGSDPLVDEPAEPAAGTVWHLDSPEADSVDDAEPANEPDVPAAPDAPAVPPVIPVPSFDSYESTASRAEEPETTAEHEGAPVAEPTTAPVVESAPMVEPPVAETSSFTEAAHREPTPPDTTTFEPPSFFEALRLPEPPVWNIDTEPAAETGPAGTEPTTPATEERQATPPLFTPPPLVTPPPLATPPAAEADVPEPHPQEPQAQEDEEQAPEAEESHGLAALLGFFGEDDTEEPASTSRSVIGDTTGIIPIPPGALTPPAVPTPPAVSPPPAVLTPPAVPTPPVVPASPVLPPPDASALFEPGIASGQSSADVPTAKLDTAEIAALLRARPGDPEPVTFGVREEPAEPSESTESTGAIPAVPPAATVPPIEEATFLLGALPSPATQPLDAESIGEASEPTAVADPTDGEPPAAEPTAEGEAPTAATILFPELASPATAETIALVPPVAPASTPAPQSATQTGSHAATTPVAPAVVPATATATGPSGTGAGTGGGAPSGPGAGGSRRTNRILFWVAGGLAVVLVLIGLFALGTRVPDMFGAAKPSAAPSASTAPPSATPTPTPTPTIQAKPAGPVAAGTHPWNTLGGGECIQPFTSPWAETFAVVDCASPHTAQLAYTNLFSTDIAAPYPGADALAAQINAVCTQPGIIDLAAAAAYPDLQLQGTFPATEQQWKDGQRSFYCFVSRSGGQPLTSSVAGPGPAA